ncbi:hypothetical protein [Streptomyces sp. NPDC005046]
MARAGHADIDLPNDLLDVFEEGRLPPGGRGSRSGRVRPAAVLTASMVWSSADLGHVAAPHLVRGVGGEVAAHKVRERGPFAGAGQPAPAADLPSGQAEFGHQTRDGVHRDPPAGADQEKPDQHLLLNS